MGKFLKSIILESFALSERILGNFRLSLKGFGQDAERRPFPPISPILQGSWKWVKKANILSEFVSIPCSNELLISAFYLKGFANADKG